MDIWNIRKRSDSTMQTKFKDRELQISALFSVLEQCIDICNTHKNNDYFHVVGATLAKGRNYAIGSYSLILDGIGQEAGALLRPYIEYLELLTYFRLKHSRINEALEDKLPSAGKRATLISGEFKELRDYLNENSSHSSYSEYSLSHIVKANRDIKKLQRYSEEVLERNVRDLYVQIWLFCSEAIKALDSRITGIVSMQAMALEIGKSKSKDIFNFMSHE